MINQSIVLSWWV